MLMNIELINKLDEITNIIENDKHLKKLKLLEKEIEKDKVLMSKIKAIKKIDKYSNEYLNIKKEILNNESFMEYKKIENDLFFIIQDINKKLNSLKEKGGCR
jgi:cell fate (sporulation/competence/biofilm development) regulator YlbF (YheA/YmcA/DUF963 family)